RGRRGVGRGGRWPATGPVPTVGGAGIARRHRRRKHAMIAHLVQSYGYYAVFALIAPESLGIPLPGESALIAAALYARTTHHLNIAALAAAAAAGAVWSGMYAFGASALGNAASSIGSTITIVGLAVAGVLTAATIVIGRRSLRRIEQQAEDAFPDQPAPSPAPAGRAA